MAASSDLRPEALRLITYGGAPMYVSDLKHALDLLGNKLVQIYGQGESPMTITHLSREMHADRQHPRWEQRLASAGRPIPAWRCAWSTRRGVRLPRARSARSSSRATR